MLNIDVVILGFLKYGDLPTMISLSIAAYWAKEDALNSNTSIPVTNVLIGLLF
jgi:hypothetical protein